MGKEEKKFLKKFSEDIEIYCEDEGIKHKKDIYEKFGSPYSVVSEFYESEDTDIVIKKISAAKHIRVAAVVGVIAVLIAAVAVSVGAYIHAQAELTERIALVEEVIEDGTGTVENPSTVQMLEGSDPTTDENGDDELIEEEVIE
jgi:hypothetical protein